MRIFAACLNLGYLFGTIMPKNLCCNELTHSPLSSLCQIHTGLPQISETAILQHSRYLSENIGYRTVGTREHALGDKYVLDEANKIKASCDDVLKMAPTRKLQCEVWRQEGSGTHR